MANEALTAYLKTWNSTQNERAKLSLYDKIAILSYDYITNSDLTTEQKDIITKYSKEVIQIILE
jgi:hypothetical protein